jgi:biopolymer transport protein ExbB/TolQ
MNVGALLQSAIYLISSSMLYPAMFLLVAGFALVVVSFGAAIADWAERRRARKKGETREKNLVPRELDEILSRPDVSWDDVENLWDHVRMESWKKLDYLRILTRLCPAMGLVGTLIPMSTGLASLSQGDVSRLSGDLVVAFSTTVVGLCAGVGAYVLYTVRSRWLEEELQALRIAMEYRASKVFDSTVPDCKVPGEERSK